MTLDYIQPIPILAPAITGYIPVRITSSIIGLKTCAIAAEVKKQY